MFSVLAPRFGTNVAQVYRPTITIWNRLEGRTRAEDFDRAMKAEVRDALWMISRQWQMGEFIGDDAGSPTLAKTHIETTQLNKYQGGSGPILPLETNIPLEVKVEHQGLPFVQGGMAISLDLRLLMGRYWLRLVAEVDSSLKGEYLRLYGIDPPDSSAESDARLCAHAKVWQQFGAVAGRCIDGFALYDFLKSNADKRASHDVNGIAGTADRDALDSLGFEFIDWFEKLYLQPQPEGNPSWRPENLEHQFRCSAPKGAGEKVLTADEYYHGHLDWYNLDISHEQSVLPDIADGAAAENTESDITRSFIPTMVTFGGMPHPRWWTFENRKTDLSFVKPDTPDLNKLLLLEFMLLYANDWFIVPVTLPAGSIATVKGLMVTNVFGERTWVEAAGSGSDEDWQRWNMYSMNVRGDMDVPADLGLAVLPVARKVLESKPLEEVFLLRDEIANMVWGVEALVPMATGKSRPGKEAGYELKTKLQMLLDASNPTPTEIEYNADIKYQIVNTVPEEWIPLIPVHVEGNRRQIQLQRAAMPRILENDDRVPRKIEPRTSLLRAGLEDGERYYIHEEEVPRAGIRVRKSYQRTRWYDGRVYNWLGIRKTAGKGGGSSGLAFDQLVSVKTDKS